MPLWCFWRKGNIGGLKDFELFGENFFDSHNLSVIIPASVDFGYSALGKTW